MSKATNIGALIAQLTEQRALDLTNPAAVRAYLDANSVLHHSAASALEHLVAERDAAVAAEREACAVLVADLLRFADTTSSADIEIPARIRARNAGSGE